MVSKASRQRRSPAREAVFKAIADPTRRDILRLLRGTRCSVNELAANFRMSRPAVSKHLRQLRDAGLVTARQEGVTVMCELDARPLRFIRDWLSDYEAFWTESLQNLKAYVEEDP